MNRFVIGDLHFGHRGIAKRRGFDDVEAHDVALMTNWAGVVTDRDMVYVLGDVSMHNYDAAAKWLRMLPGRKILIGGNHDDAELADLFDSVYGAIVVSACKKAYKCIMTHIPIHPQEFYRWNFNIHGHLHDKFVYEDWQMPDFETGVIGTIKDKRYINVSAEQMNMCPQPLDDVVLRHAALKEGIILHEKS